MSRQTFAPLLGHPKMFGEAYTLWSSLSCNLTQLTSTSSFL